MSTRHEYNNTNFVYYTRYQKKFLIRHKTKAKKLKNDKK